MCSCENNSSVLTNRSAAALTDSDPNTITPVSIQIESNVTTVPGGFALTGFVDVEKLLNITCNNIITTFFLEKKLPFQVLFMQVCPIPTSPPSVCTCGFLTTTPVTNVNQVKFNDGTGPTETAELTLQGFVCQNNPSSNLSFSAVSIQNNLQLSASTAQITSVTCTTQGNTCNVNVMGTGTATLNNTAVTNPGFTLTIHCTPGNVTYEMVVTSNGNQIFTTNGQVSPISTSQLVCFCS